MKKILLLFVAASIVMVSCKEEATEPLEAEYAKYSVEENKANIEQEGLAVLEKMDAMKQMQAPKGIQQLMFLMENDETFGFDPKVANLLRPLANADQQLLGIAELRSTNESTENLSDLFEAKGGVYTFSATDSSFDRAPSATEITFVFPLGTSTTNNGKLSISNYTYKVATNTDFQGTELPKTLSITMKDGATSLLSLEVIATYGTNDLPSSEKTTFSVLEGYSFAQEATYKEDKITWDFGFGYQKKDFFKGGFDMTGTFPYAQLKNELAIDMINQVDAQVQLGNLKAVGKMAYAKMMENMESMGNTPVASQEEVIDLMCTVMNEHIKVVLLYADDVEAIAKLNFYRGEETDYRYNMETQQEELVTYPSLGIKFAFKDGSAMDDSFFQTGFNDLKAAWTSFVNDMMTNYNLAE